MWPATPPATASTPPVPMRRVAVCSPRTAASRTSRDVGGRDHGSASAQYTTAGSVVCTATSRCGPPSHSASSRGYVARHSGGSTSSPTTKDAGSACPEKGECVVDGRDCRVPGSIPPSNPYCPRSASSMLAASAANPRGDRTNTRMVISVVVTLSSAMMRMVMRPLSSDSSCAMGMATSRKGRAGLPWMNSPAYLGLFGSTLTYTYSSDLSTETR
mmetsp:Transcript_13858/g.33439  ORF Transcript_13858/g.33439 Transcript_13858/m.33439 type:complete len:215 (+) Transcript_13858:613-1257(+)